MSSKRYQPRNVLITGGAGFIGANFVRMMLQTFPSSHIINLDALTYAGSENNLRDLPAPDRHVFIKGDITDATLVHDILHRYTIDTIVHFAAESHVDRSIFGPFDFVRTNIIGTYTLLEEARHYWLGQQKWHADQCRFHHVSTDEVYGALTKDAAPFTEQTAYAPNSPYSASKASSDHWARAYYHTYQLPVTISHCSNNYGPYQHPEKFIPTVIQSCLAQQPIPIYGEGKQIRDWLYVDDHCRGILKILTEGEVGQTYNMGGECELANLDLAKHICILLDEKIPMKKPHESLIHFVTDRPGHDFRYAIDNRFINKSLQWHPQVPFMEGLAKTVQFYLNTKSC